MSSDIVSSTPVTMHRISVPVPVPLIADQSKLAWRRTHQRITNERRAVTGSSPTYPIEATLKGEPRIQYLKRLLEQCLSHGTFTFQGKPVKVDAFKLKNMENWTMEGPTTPEEILQLLSERCEVKCEFCYLRMDPTNTVTKFNPNRTEHIQEDIDLRLDLMTKGKRLFSPTFQLEEIIGHAEFRTVMRKIRQHSEEVICLNTTGSALTEDMIDFLQEMEPVEVRVSLNSVSPAERYRLMHDKKGLVLRALESLHKRNMRFSVSIVMWPNLPWQELEAAIRFADACQPYAIIAILPGFTDQFSAEALFNTDEYWLDVVQRVGALRFSIDTPLMAHPRLYEENELGYPANQPLVIGITPRSSSAKAGLRIGDIIVGIDEFLPIFGRRQVDSLLLLKHQQNPEKVVLHVIRNREQIQLTLDVAESYKDGYPYVPPFIDRLGIVLISQGVAISDLRELSRIALAKKAKVVAVATSSIVLPSLQRLLDEWKVTLFSHVEIVPFIPRNKFYGGNICLGELCTASDFLDSIEDLHKSRPDVELVVIPSPAFGPGGWWRDLEGVSFTRLSRNSPISVEMLVCSAFE